MLAQLNSNENERLEALRGFGILDTPTEQSFDDITNLSAEICGVPVCLISFVDENRQWFKSKIGIDICETPYEQSICAHAVAQNDFLEVSDTLQDLRTVDNPLCLGEIPFRFYAGAIMRTSSGLPMGTLCVLDYQPRRLTSVQQTSLRVHTNHIVKLLELRVALGNEKILRREIDHRVKNSLQTVSAFLASNRIIKQVQINPFLET